MTARELIERGIRAFGRGKLNEAERCWRDALVLEPGDARARAYLEQLLGKLVEEAEPEAVPPVPLPEPGAGRPSAPAWEQSRPAQGPVPLPRPGGSGAPVSPAPLAAAATLGLASHVGAVPLPGLGTTLSAFPRAALEEARAQASAPSQVRPRPDDPFLPSALGAGRLDRALAEFAPSPWDEAPRTPALVLAEGIGLDLSSVAEQSGIRPLVPEAGPEPRPALGMPRSEVEVWMEGARELFALGDFSGSLEMIEKILRVDPTHGEARAYLAQNESTLTAMYESKLGPQATVPRLAIKPEEVMWLNLDHRAGFLLAQIDGDISFEDLFALSGLPRLDTARILAALLQEGVIAA